jgi:hypothetical protein
MIEDVLKGNYFPVLECFIDGGNRLVEGGFRGGVYNPAFVLVLTKWQKNLLHSLL